MKSHGTCKLTGKNGTFVKAHIIPKSFFLLARDPNDAGPFVVLNTRASHPPKKSWDGVYDENLVTAEGEEYFNSVDSYAYSLLSPLPTRSNYIRDEHGFIARNEPWQKLGYLIKKFDYPKLRSFFDTLFWRISVSEQEYFQAVKFPNEEVLRQNILARRPTSTDLYNVAIVRHLDEWGTLNLSPHKWKAGMSEGIRLTCGTFSFYFLFGAVDDPLDACLITEGRPLAVLTSPIGDTAAYRIAKTAVERTAKRWRK